MHRRLALLLLLLPPFAGCGTLLSPDRFPVIVCSIPSGATVVYEGAVVGETPCEVVVTRAAHRFDLHRPGHRTRRVDCGTVRNDWLLANVVTLGVGAFVDHAAGAHRNPDTAPILVHLSRGESDVVVPWARWEPMPDAPADVEPTGVGEFVTLLLQSAFGWWNGTSFATPAARLSTGAWR